jgi:hypothetical protein
MPSTTIPVGVAISQQQVQNKTKVNSTVKLLNGVYQSASAGNNFDDSTAYPSGSAANVSVGPVSNTARKRDLLELTVPVNPESVPGYPVPDIVTGVVFVTVTWGV